MVYQLIKKIFQKSCFSPYLFREHASIKKKHLHLNYKSNYIAKIKQRKNAYTNNMLQTKKSIKLRKNMQPNPLKQQDEVAGL
jgi:hypothetical protein